MKLGDTDMIRIGFQEWVTEYEMCVQFIPLTQIPPDAITTVSSINITRRGSQPAW